MGKSIPQKMKIQGLVQPGPEHVDGATLRFGPVDTCRGGKGAQCRWKTFSDGLQQVGPIVGLGRGVEIHINPQAAHVLACSGHDGRTIQLPAVRTKPHVRVDILGRRFYRQVLQPDAKRKP